MTTIDWYAVGTEEWTAARFQIRQHLEAAGVVLNTAYYHQAYQDFRRGQEATSAALFAEREARERQRIEPYMGKAREWVSEDDDYAAKSSEEIEKLVVEEATRMADEVDEIAIELARKAERDAEDDADRDRRRAAIEEAVSAATAVAIAAGWRLEWRPCSHASSRYYWLLLGGDPDVDDDYEKVFSLRISDHYARNGSGWNEEKQEHYDLPDINIVTYLWVGDEYTFDLTPLKEMIARHTV